MSTVAATPAAIAGLLRAKATAENELRTMRRINHAFKQGRRAFVRRGFAAADFERFTDAMKRNPECGPVPFSPRMVLAKMTQIERIERQIAIGKQLLIPAKAS